MEEIKEIDIFFKEFMEKLAPLILDLCDAGYGSEPLIAPGMSFWEKGAPLIHGWGDNK